MIDIIIPIYEYNKYLKNTLISICLQEIKDMINVIIVDNSNNKNVDNIIKLFDDKFNIKVLKLNEKNQNLIQYGINNSNNEYIIFIENGDIFYNPFSIQYLYNAINENNADLICGIIYEEENNKMIVTNGNNNIFGKIYKRKLLINNNIELKENIDKLIKKYNPKMFYIEEKICIIKLTKIKK